MRERRLVECAVDQGGKSLEQYWRWAEAGLKMRDYSGALRVV
jgi:hypothetical protein